MSPSAAARPGDAPFPPGLFRSLLDGAGDTWFLLDPADDFRVRYINDAGLRHFGWPREQVLAMRPWDWDPNFTPESMRGLRELLRSRGSLAYETSTRRATGGPVRVEAVSSLLRHEGLEWIAGCYRDITARARAEAELRASEERFRAVFEEASDAILLVDPADYRIVDCNGVAARLFAAGSRAHLLGREPQELHAVPGFTAGIAAIRSQVLATGSWSGTLEYRSFAGRHFWGAVVCRRIHVDGRPLHILRITDTTENRRLVELLADTERLARIGGWEYHLEERRLVWTDGACLIHGVPPGTQVTPEEALAMHAPPYREAIEAASRESMTTGRAWTIESCILREGRETWVRLTCAVEMSDGRARRMHGTIEDISESHRAADSLRERDERLHEHALLLDQAADAIVVCDAAGCIQLWNRGAERLLGWTAEEAIGRHAGTLHFASQDQFVSTLTVARPLGQWHGELEQRTRAGTLVLVESRWTLILDPAGQPRTILTINTDITERRRREAGMLRAQRLESIGTLAGGIAHDLNNILAPVVLSSDILRMRLKDEADLELIQAIGSSARRGAEVVRQVLSFARGVEGNHVPVNFRHLLPELRHIVAETFPRTITCRVEAPHDLWTVMGEPTQLHQVLLNLCLNARDAMPAGGTLALRAANIEVDAVLAAQAAGARTGPHVRIQVSDTGEGIAPQVRDRIFEPFFTTRGPGRGSGLGLSTAMAIVRSHRGFITVESAPGAGTTLSVHLPAEQPSTTPAPAGNTPAATTGARGAPHRGVILVIDDEASVRSITRQSLESAGYRVLGAEDGARGVAQFVQHQAEVALVLTDLMMPVMDGVAVIKALRRIAPATRIIAMSGATDAAGLAQNLSPSPGVGFLLKPFNLDTLLRTVHEALEHPAEP